MKFFPVFFVLLTLILSPLSVMAAEFAPGRIIEDSDMLDKNAMSLTDIRDFLSTKSGILKSLLTEDMNGTPLSAAEIIYHAAQTYGVNPKVLLVMLQKEQSLVEDVDPSEKQLAWAMGYGVCDDCSMDDPRIQKFKGFGKQVDNCAGAQRWYIDNTANGWIKTYGQSYTISGQEILIENQATANLYNYTPHIAGNYNFWKIWQHWFFQKYPDGTLLQVPEEPGVWLLQDGQRRPFFSRSALRSRFNDRNIVLIGKSELNQYPVGKPIKFSNYTIFKTPFGNVYMLIDDRLRKFESNEVIRAIGYNPEEFVDLSLEEFSDYELGPEITLASAYPLGALLQDKTTGAVWFVQDGVKYPLIAKDILVHNFPTPRLIPTATADLEKFTAGDAIKLKDGLLVKPHNSPTVYVISNGQKMPILSGDVFEKLGYRWENIISVEEKALSNLPEGNVLEITYKE